jgi:hypothetical protein
MQHLTIHQVNSDEQRLIMNVADGHAGYVMNGLLWSEKKVK